jgi:RNA polymerase sigma-70 factor (ECF subfamily)
LLLERLYERHHRMVRAVCQLILRNPIEAEDAAQQTFVSALGSLNGGTVPRNAPAWLAMIARRECWARSAQRQQQPIHLEDYDDVPTDGDSVVDQAARNADFAALWKAINILPRQQRSAFLLREFSGLSYAEAAEALGVTESAIESLLVRARRQLKDGLEPVLKAANLAATPVLLLQRRIRHLLGFREATEASAGAAILVPAAIKVGAGIVAAVAVAAGSVDVARTALGSGKSDAASASALVAPLTPLVRGFLPNDPLATVFLPGTESFPLLLLIGEDPVTVELAVTEEPAAITTDSIMIPDAPPTDVAPATDPAAAPTDAAPTTTTPAPAGAPPADPAATAAPAAPADEPAPATPEDATPAPADAPPDPAPADDPTPAAAEATPDPTPADAAPTTPAAAEPVH